MKDSKSLLKGEEASEGERMKILVQKAEEMVRSGEHR